MASKAGGPRFPRSTRFRASPASTQAYLVRALQAYKSGERSHPTMKAIAASLSDQDMADVAAYYAQPATRVAGK